MTSKELEKYLNKHISFTVNELAYIPAPVIVKDKDTRNNSKHYEGILRKNNGLLSHFALDFFNEWTGQFEGIAIRDDSIPYIENLIIMEN